MPLQTAFLNSSGLWEVFSGGVDDTTVDPPVVTRAALTGLQGTYKPTGPEAGTASTAGVPVGLTLAAGSTAGLTAGQIITLTGGPYVFENLDIQAYVQLRTAQSVVFRNCFIRGYNRPFSGAGGETALVNCDHSALTNTNVLFEDCTFIPDYPNTYIDAVIGHDFELRRCLIENTVDGLGVRNTTNSNGPARVKVYASIIRNLAFFKPDIHHTDWTHNDGIQIFGNSNYRIVGNIINDNMSTTEGTHDSPYAPSMTGQAIAMTPTSGVTSDVLIDRNWLDYGANSITITKAALASPTAITITNNKFGRHQPNLSRDGVTARRPILWSNKITPAITGFSTAAVSVDTVNGNTWEDTGDPINVYRGAFTGE